MPATTVKLDSDDDDNPANLASVSMGSLPHVGSLSHDANDTQVQLSKFAYIWISLTRL